METLVEVSQISCSKLAMGAGYLIVTQLPYITLNSNQVKVTKQLQTFILNT